MVKIPFSGLRVQAIPGGHLDVERQTHHNTVMTTKRTICAIMICG
jgi:hypothetical protein